MLYHFRLCNFYLLYLSSVLMKNKISSKRISELNAFCSKRNLHFDNLELLDLAFHHRSFSNENSVQKFYNNERLEFLGDSVLGLATADFLFNDMKENPEGELAKIKAQVVSEKTLAPVALSFGIDKLLVMGRGEELSGGRTKPAILADCMEAIIGAYYIDQGFEAAEKYVLSFIIPQIRLVQQYGGKDFKTLLQEFYQKKYKKCPVYKTVSVSGPDHDQTFEVTVTLGDTTYKSSFGKSKKEAEQLAAKKALEFIFGKDIGFKKKI